MNDEIYNRVFAFLALVWRWLPVALEIAGLVLWASFLWLRKAVRHSLCLYGKRTFSGDDCITYRFAIQNNEDVPLKDNWRLKLTVLNEDGAFLESAPGDAGQTFAVYAGCTTYQVALCDSRRERGIRFNELPAYETWTMDCVMNPQSRDVRLEIEIDAPPKAASSSSERGEDQPRRRSRTAESLLSHSRLTLAADRSSALVGHRRTPEISWAVGVVSIALIAYLIVVFNFVPGIPLFWAVIAVLIISSCGAFTYYLTHRQAPKVVQGYWTDSETLRRNDAKERAV